MSTETSRPPRPPRSAADQTSRRARSRRLRTRGFVLGFVAVAAILAVIGGVGAMVGVLLGPRVTAVQVDPAAAVSASGSRLIVTTSQSLAEVDPSRVTVTPATPFEVDTSGRSVGVRFTVPLDAETEYTVSIGEVTGISGGPSSTITESFTTPPSEVFLLQRGTPDGDTIFRTDLTGEAAVPVFAHEHIEDYRATRDHLVVLIERDGGNVLVMTDLDGQNPVELALPGDGYIAALQTSDRGERIGYLFTSAGLAQGSGDESALYTASLDTPTAPPTRVTVPGADPRIGQWSFVPDTEAVLLVTFDGSLLLTAPDGSTSTSLGSALAIDGISSGSADAIVERIGGIVALDLITGSEVAIPDAPAATGLVGTVLPLPRGGTLRTYFATDDAGMPTGETSLVVVGEDGATTEVLRAPGDDAVLQTCVSPSGQYAAVVVAPDLATNPYDAYQLPIPDTVQTHVLALPPAGGEAAQEVVVMAGFAISWCRQPISWR